MTAGNTKSERAKNFGKYLKSLRQESGGSVRTAATQVGLSFSHLARLERGEVGRPPPLRVLARVAALYEKPLEEVLERAGVEVNLESPDSVPSGEEQFSLLMLSAEFQPPSMEAAHLQHFL